MLIGMLAWAAAATQAVTQTGGELVVTPGEPVAATVDGRAARLLVESGGIDRVTLDEDYVAANAIKPGFLIGGAALSVAGRREFQGRNRPVTLVVVGRTLKGRAFWFKGAPDSGVDGRVGPYGLPQARVTFTLAAARPGETVTRMQLVGGGNSGSYAGVRFGDRNVALSLAVEDDGRMPVATAAFGAAIAREYGGVLEGATWDVEILLGVKRPVRLMRLAKPLAVGPLSFDRIAVRVRDRIDESGRGAAIPEAGEVEDPDEVVVTAKAGGRPPAFGMTLPRATLAGCSRLTYDKTAGKIELACAKS